MRACLPEITLLGERVRKKCGVRTSAFRTHRAGALGALARNLQRLFEGWEWIKVIKVGAFIIIKVEMNALI